MKNFEKLTKTHLNFEASEIVFSVDPRIYPKDIILKACYAIIDRVYIFLDSPGKTAIDVCLKTKGRSTRKQLVRVRDEFLNELVNASIRKMVSIRNQKIVEHIVGGAVNAALMKPNMPLIGGKSTEDEDIQEIEKEIEALKKELENDSEDTYEEDPREIRKPILHDDDNKI